MKLNRTTWAWIAVGALAAWTEPTGAPRHGELVSHSKHGGTMDRKDLDKNAGKNPVIHHDDNPGVGDHIGEAAGGTTLVGKNSDRPVRDEPPLMAQ